MYTYICIRISYMPATRLESMTNTWGTELARPVRSPIDTHNLHTGICMHA